MDISKYQDDQLRDYQLRYKKEIYELWKKHRSVMLQMPTGTGKTRLFASIVRDIHDHGVRQGKAYKVLILVHRQELLDQAAQTLGIAYSVAHGIIMSGTRQQMFYPTQIASIQTLNRRLNSWVDKQFDFIIIDEAHHALSDSYKRICNTFKTAKILGVTATPYRLSGEGFKSLFNEIVISERISHFIENNYLAKYDYYSIPPTSAIQRAIDQIDTFDIDGDYAIAAMSRVVDTNYVQANIIETYRKYALGKKGIVYTINKQHNNHVCHAYINAGFIARAIDSDTTPEVRANIIQQFKSGRIQILCNVNIFSEGFDCPDVEFIQLARPTTSLSLYLQQVGRGLRIHPEIERVIFLDNVGSYNKYGLPSSYRNWRKYFDGWNPKLKDQEEENERLKDHGNICTIYEIEEEFIEGNADVGLIYTIEDEKTQESYNYELADFDDYEEYYVPKKVDDEDIDFWFFSKYYYDDWTLDSDYFEFEETSENNAKLSNKYSESGYQLKRVKHDNKWGLYDCSSKELILPIIYDEIAGATIFGKSLIKENDKYGVFCVHNLKFDLKCEFDEIIFIPSKIRFNQCIALKNGLYGLVSYNFEIILNFEYDLIYMVKFGYFADDVQLFARKDYNDLIILDDNVIISKLDPVKPVGQYFIIEYNDKLGISNSKGEILFPPIFKSINYINGFYKATRSLGLILVFNEDLSLFINENLKKFDSVFDKYFIVQKNPSGCGLIDLKGNIIVDFIYQELIIREGIICIRKDNKWHVIDLDGIIYASSTKIADAVSEFKRSSLFSSKQYRGLVFMQKEDKAKIDDNKGNQLTDHIVDNKSKNNKESFSSSKSMSKESTEKGSFEPQPELDKILESYFKTNKKKKNKKKENSASNKSKEVDKTVPNKNSEKKKRPRIRVNNEMNQSISERRKK